MTGFSKTANVTNVMTEVINSLAAMCQPSKRTSENLKSNPSANAEAYGLISGGELHSLVIIRGGSGYLSAPTVTISGGGQGSGDTTATATAVLTGGTVTGITITNEGSGFTEPPLVVIGDSPDSTTVTGDGTTTVFNGGLGYIPVSPASVTIQDQDGLEVFTDNSGSGKLTSTLGGTGTINYQTGAVSLTFVTVLANGKNIQSTYTYGRYSQFKVVRNGLNFGGNNVQLSMVDNFTGLPYLFTASFSRQDVAPGTKS
jgi:hypothetical protein